jgi:hypothetical protein
MHAVPHTLTMRNSDETRIARRQVNVELGQQVLAAQAHNHCVDCRLQCRLRGNCHLNVLAGPWRLKRVGRRNMTARLSDGVNLIPSYYLGGTFTVTGQWARAGNQRDLTVGRRLHGSRLP